MYTMSADLSDGWVYRPGPEIESTSPCRAAGMSVSEENALREISCRDIVTFVGALAARWAKRGHPETAAAGPGARPKFPSRIHLIQVASIFFHRGCTRLSMATNSPIVLVVTCVFLAAKVEEAKHVRLRDVFLQQLVALLTLGRCPGTVALVVVHVVVFAVLVVVVIIGSHLFTSSDTVRTEPAVRTVLRGVARMLAGTGVRGWTRSEKRIQIRANQRF